MKIKKIRYHLLFKVFTLLFIVSSAYRCAPSMKYTWSKEGVQGKEFEKIAVIVIGKDFEIRSLVESKVSKDLEQYGITMVKGTSFLGINASKNDWQPDIISKKLKSLGVDGAISISLINIRDKSEFVQGESYVYPSGYYRYGKHIYTTYSRVYTPSYYKDVKEYIVESSLYDVSIEKPREKALLWKG